MVLFQYRSADNTTKWMVTLRASGFIARIATVKATLCDGQDDPELSGLGRLMVSNVWCQSSKNKFLEDTAE
jgi:hypothetical protein